MSKYSGTKTEKNLMAAFAGESEARNKYTYFASKAKKDGFEQIAALFLKTADNEKEHAKMWYKEFAGIGSTAENLKTAADGENYEWTDMYAGFAETAEKGKDSGSLRSGIRIITDSVDGCRYVGIWCSRAERVWEHYFLNFNVLVEMCY